MPVNGNHTLRLTLYGSPSGGDLIAGPITRTAYISNGRFTTILDFGGSAFTGDARWLQVALKPTAPPPWPLPAPDFTDLHPRLEVNSAPYAIRAKEAGVASNVISGSVVKSLNGLKDNVVLAAGANVTLTTNGNTLTIDSTGDTGGGGWSALNTNTYYTLGNVGVGTSDPTSTLDVRGPLTLDTGGNAVIITGTGGSELNRYLALFNSQGFASASGLKAGGVLVADSYAYANPGKNNLVVKGYVGVGTPSPGAPLQVDNNWAQTEKANVRMKGDQPSIEWWSDDAALLGKEHRWLAQEDDSRDLNFSFRTRDTSQFPVLDSGWQSVLKLRRDSGVSSSNYSIRITGNAIQSRDNSGWVKAMAKVSANRSLVRQYSAYGGSITVEQYGTEAFSYVVTFPFQVSDRFISVTPVRNDATQLRSSGSPYAYKPLTADIQQLHDTAVIVRVSGYYSADQNWYQVGNDFVITVH